jgi:hypothetical protein
MTPDELLAAAREGTLTPAQVESIHEHLTPDTPLPARRLATRAAAAWIAHHDDPALTLELIRIAENRDPALEELRDVAVRALAKATGYHGRPVRFEL